MNSSEWAPPPGSTSEQADYWLVLLNSPLANREVYRSFQAWLDQSPEHRAAWDKSLAFWTLTNNLNRSQLEELERKFGPTEKASKKVKRPNLIFRILRLRTIAAGAALLFALGIGLQNLPYYLADYRTGTGEQRMLRLSDGSRILMNTATTLSVDLNETRRVVTLLEGEAYFRVASDRDRPFEVKTENGLVRALGTAFDVSQRDGKLAVTVFNHAVQLRFPEGETLERLDRGHRVAHNPNGTGPIETVDTRRSGAWHHHRLIFKDQTLKQVISELNRYRPGKVLLFGTRLKQRPVSGVFDTRNTDSALDAIAQTLSVSVYHTVGGFIFLLGS